MSSDSLSRSGGHCRTSGPDESASNSTATNGWWKKTHVEGFGRELNIERGDAEATRPVKEYEYRVCDYSPIGKLKQESTWHAPGHGFADND